MATFGMYFIAFDSSLPTSYAAVPRPFFTLLSLSAVLLRHSVDLHVCGGLKGWEREEVQR